MCGNSARRKDIENILILLHYKLDVQVLKLWFLYIHEKSIQKKSWNRSYVINYIHIPTYLILIYIRIVLVIVLPLTDWIKAVIEW